MAKPPVPAHIVEMLEKPNAAVMGTVNAHGEPVTVATWYLWENGKLLLNMDATRARLKHVQANPKVSLTVLADNWYTHVSLRGTATLEDDPDMSGIDRIAKHYNGKPYPDRSGKRVNCWVEIESWHGWGEFKDA
jgi:PPOX class probable F420-dependent enzyme